MTAAPAKLYGAGKVTMGMACQLRAFVLDGTHLGQDPGQLLGLELILLPAASEVKAQRHRVDRLPPHLRTQRYRLVDEQHHL